MIYIYFFYCDPQLGAPGVFGRPKRFGYKGMVKIAYTRVRHSRTLAKCFNCSPHAIRRIRFGLALAYELTQDSLCLWTLQKLRRNPPDFGISSLLWDETGQPVTLTLKDNVKSEQASTVWQVLVCRRRFVWGWIRKVNGVLKALTMQMNFVCPLVPLLGVSAHDIYNGLEHHPQTRMATIFEAELMKVVKRCYDLKGCDHAPSNDKYSAFKYSDKVRNKFSQTTFCFNHSGQLIESHAVALSGYYNGEVRSILNTLFSMALFVRMLIARQLQAAPHGISNSK